MTHRHDLIDNLSPDDQRLVDALVESGFDPAALGALSPSEQDKVRTLTSLFELLDDYPVEDADETLVHATLARIDRYEDQLTARLAFDDVAAEEEMPRGRRLRIPDFISIAAVILIGASVVWPVTSHLRHKSAIAGCGSNLRLLGMGFDQYAGDYDYAMPMAKTNPGTSWDSYHNVVNLKPMIDGGYCQLHHMTCPGHRGRAGESFSYRWQIPGQRATWGVHHITVVLGDRNPIIDAARQNRLIPPLSMSLNHNLRGQNTLSSDGSIMFLEQPLIGVNDNIWLPTGFLSLRRGDQPTDPWDIFLAH